MVLQALQETPVYSVSHHASENVYAFHAKVLGKQKYKLWHVFSLCLITAIAGNNIVREVCQEIKSATSMCQDKTVLNSKGGRE
jgi:hypothetical protein